MIGFTASQKPGRKSNLPPNPPPFSVNQLDFGYLLVYRAWGLVLIFQIVFSPSRQPSTGKPTHTSSLELTSIQAMVNPGAFQGTRFQFLLTQKAEWERAIQDGTTRETLLTIQRRYFKRYPIDLPHDVEPSEEHLAAVDDDAPDDDINAAELASEFVVPITGNKPMKRGALVKFRKNQIYRWLQYQHTKDHDLDSKDARTSNPYSALIGQLTGRDPEPPRKKSAANVWRKTKAAHDAIEQEFQREVSQAQAKNKPIPKSEFITRRDLIARTLFSNLPESEREKWELKAVNAKKAAKAEYDEGLNTSMSTKPEDRQRAIQTLPQVVMPILDFISEATGWKATLIVGGPEPAQGGQLNVLSVHSGTTGGEVQMNFGQSERERYKEYIIPIFGSFLKRCYTPAECRSRALPRDSDLVPLSMLEPGTNDEPNGLGEENPRTFIHPIETGLEVNNHPQPVTPNSVANNTPATPRSASPSRDEDVFPYSLRDDAEWPPSEYTDSPQSSPTVSRCGTPSFERSQELEGTQLRRQLPPPGLIITSDDNFTFPPSASAEEQDCPVMYLPSVQFVTAGGYTTLHSTPTRPMNPSKTTPQSVIDPMLTGKSQTSVNDIIRSAISTPSSQLFAGPAPSALTSVGSAPVPEAIPSLPIVSAVEQVPISAGVVSGPNIQPRTMVDFVLSQTYVATPSLPVVNAPAISPPNNDLASNITSTVEQVDSPGSASLVSKTTPQENSGPLAHVQAQGVDATPRNKRVVDENMNPGVVIQTNKRRRMKSEKALALEMEDERKKAKRGKGSKKNVGSEPPDERAANAGEGPSTAPSEGLKRGRGRPKKVVSQSE